MIERKQLLRAALAVLAICLGPAEAAMGGINLELRLTTPPSCDAQVIDVQLVAVSDSAEIQYLSAMDVVLHWNAGDMTLEGVTNNGPYAWLYAGLPANDLDGLNLNLSDGDALFTAMSQLFGGPAAAGPQGLLVTTIRFHRAAPGGHARLRIIASAGEFSTTAVYDGFVPNLNVVGSLGSATLGGEACDTNCDGSVNQFDIQSFVQVLLTRAGCSRCAGDANGNGTVNQFDINGFIACLLR